ncbi:MAG: hypothetical protein FJX62_22230 [Alphaproteobacteria bacterium]|nr:hypothetical protein [Alphaproteobacteria bacterium]
MAHLNRRSFMTAAASFAAVGPAMAQAGPAPVAYRSINGKDLKLRPFVGRRTALLIDPARPVDRASVERILAAFDRGWEWYLAFFEVDVSLKKQHAGKLTIAEVADQGFIYGAGGIEILPSSTTLLLNEAAHDRYNQSAFYCMGLNCWGSGKPLGIIDAFLFGFADVHRFHCMEGAGITGAPWDVDLDFDHYRHSILIDLLDRYLADQSLNWQNTLAAGKAPVNPRGWGANELAGAFYYRIRRDHGRAGYRRFWKMMLDAPKAETPKECASRFVQIARTATGEDYRWMFKDQTLQLVY